MGLANLDFLLSFLWPFLGVIVGVAVGYGGMRQQVGANSKSIGVLFKWRDAITGGTTGLPVYVRREECLDKHGDVEIDIAKMCKAVKGLQNYAMWHLQKDGKSFSEAKQIINGGS